MSEEQSDIDEHLHAVARALPELVFILDCHGRYVAVMGGADRSRYDGARSLVGKKMQSVLPEEKWRLFLDTVRRAIDTQTVQTCEYQLSSDDVSGTVNNGPAGCQWFRGRVSPLPRRQGHPPEALWLAINITDQKRKELLLQHDCQTDPLTGTFNRRYFSAHLSAEYQLARRHRHPLSLLALDIDHFKAINDKFGHGEGDRVLRHLVSRVAPQLRLGDTLARVGGEEFAILCPHAGRAAAAALAERIRHTVERAMFETDQGPLQLTISLGGATLDVEDRGGEDLILRADMALYQAKNQGRNRVVISPTPRTAPSFRA